MLLGFKNVKPLQLCPRETKGWLSLRVVLAEDITHGNILVVGNEAAAARAVHASPLRLISLCPCPAVRDPGFQTSCNVVALPFPSQ